MDLGFLAFLYTCAIVVGLFIWVVCNVLASEKAILSSVLSVCMGGTTLLS